MTPEEELRAAATKLRETAAATRGGPWTLVKNERGQAATSGRNTTELERRRAALYVCHRGKSLEDRRQLLLALGLLEPGFSWTSTGPHGPRKKVTE